MMFGPDLGPFFRKGSKSLDMIPEGFQGRVLALDVGEKRIGLAISDPLWSTAQPLETLPVLSVQNAVAHLAKRIREYEISLILVGLPLGSDGGETDQSTRVRTFAQAAVQGTGLPVVFFDERGTTREAERVLIQGGVRRKKRRKSKDMLAAVIILEYFLYSISI